MIQNNRLLAASLAALLLLASSVAVSAQTPEVFDQWYVLNMQGQRSGWMHVRQSEKEGYFVTETEMRLSIARAATEIRIQMAGRFTETLDHEPVRMWSLQKLASVPTETTWEWIDEGVRRTIKQGVAESTDMLPAPEGEWMTPGAAGEYTEEQLGGGAEEITVTILDPLVGLMPIEITRTVLDRDATVETMNGRRPAVKWKVVQSFANAVQSIEYVDEEGNVLRGEVDLGAIKMDLIAADRATALQKTAAPELMLDTFVRPDRRIVRPRETERLVLDLSVTDGEMPELPSVAAQTAEPIDGGIRLTIDTRGPNHADPDADIEALTGSNSYLNADDEEVRRLARQATREVRGGAPIERARAMRDFVFKYVDEKSLSVGFATASEVARERSGDCSEHGVLLAAMMRADGIPARVVSGLIYADEFAGARGIFGYHMWAQALIDGRWVDFDGTLPVDFDATHITISTTSLDEGGLSNDLSSLVPLLGRLKISVVEIGP
ncbi:MAG: transglutaminase family protein [Phycisphaerales bacterium]